MLLFLQNLGAPPVSGPLISGLNGTNTVVHGQACTISGVQFTGTVGTITLRQGSLSQVQSSGVSWADTSISFTANTAIFAYGTLVLEVTNANGTDQYNVTLNPVSGKAYLAADVPWPVGAYSVFQGAAPAVVDGDQLEYDLVTNHGGNVTMFADGTFTIDNATQDHSFAVRAFDQTDLTWSASVTIDVNYQPVVSITGPVDVDGTVLLGQVGAAISGSNFGSIAGTVTIGGVAQTVQSWSNTAITIIVNPATPIGAQTLVVNNGTTSGSISVTVAAAAGQAPVFLGPSISVTALTQGTPMSAVSIASRFTDPVGEVLTYSTVGAWPPGVTVTSIAGTIQGTPSVPGTYAGLAVRATDPDGNSVDSNNFTISVGAAVSSVPVFNGPTISVPTLVESTVMANLSVAARFSDPQGQALAFSALGAWPPGVTISTGGIIQGTPTTAGNYSGLSVRATDPDGNSADSNTFSITVAVSVVTPSPVDPTLPPSSGGVSDVAIVNLALTKLGDARITSLDDDSKPARTMKAIYELIRDAELRRRKWRFSIRRASLPALAEIPAFGYANAYQLPADCVKLLMVGDLAPGVDLSDIRTGFDTELYSLEGRQILTDLAAPLSLRYQARVTDPAQFDATFVAALASRLAYEACEDLTQSSSKKQDAMNDYRLAIREAVAANAIEVVPTPLPDDSWLLSRH